MEVFNKLSDRNLDSMAATSGLSLEVCEKFAGIPASGFCDLCRYAGFSVAPSSFITYQQLVGLRQVVTEYYHWASGKGPHPSVRSAALPSPNAGMPPPQSTPNPPPPSPRTQSFNTPSPSNSREGSLSASEKKELEGDPVGQFVISRKKQVIEQGKFFELRFVAKEVEDRFPHWQINRSEIYKGLQRMLQTVDGAISAAIAVQPLLTLHDLQKEFVMSMKDFRNFSSFSQLALGPLMLHPKVQQAFRIPQNVLHKGEIPTCEAKTSYSFLRLKSSGKGHLAVVNPDPILNSRSIVGLKHLLQSMDTVLHLKCVCTFGAQFSCLYYFQ